jgi:6-phosphogluconate dehydrogenase
MKTSSVGIIGLGVMGINFARNMARNGVRVVAYNREQSKVKDLQNSPEGKTVEAASDIVELVNKLPRPRSVIILVTAGAAVDSVLDTLLPHLESGDIVADLGNSHFKDTKRRAEKTATKGVNFLGVGISGGEEGALNGPSLMPGGNKDAWAIMAPMFDSVAAKVDKPCHTYIGTEGAGHFVKMVHNGIEYGDMELIAESYNVMRTVLAKKPAELAEIFSKWNTGPLSSFLIEITGRIFREKESDGGFLVDKILDKAEQKGTGRWTIEAAMELGVAVPTITASVDARIMSGELTLRKKLSAEGITKVSLGGASISIEDVHDALYAAKIISYAQGLSLINKASETWNWGVNLSSLATIWKGGCIIRAKLLGVLEEILKDKNNHASILADKKIQAELKSGIPALRKIVALAATAGIPMPGFASALYYLDSVSAASLPMNLVQAQRDLFGAHTFERTDKPGKFHQEWGK